MFHTQPLLSYVVSAGHILKQLKYQHVHQIIKNTLRFIRFAHHVVCSSYHCKAAIIANQPSTQTNHQWTNQQYVTYVTSNTLFLWFLEPQGRAT